MKVFIAVASGETQYVKSLRSVYELTRRDGDLAATPDKSYYGTVTRTGLLNRFRRLAEYDAILCLDADQDHPADLLEKLRASMEAGNLDMVCAHYYQRNTGPITSLCWELGDGTWPFLPLLDPPAEGLHEIGATGLGCVLIHRRVVEAVWATLPAGDNPFRPAPIPEIDPIGREFGSDLRFFILARRLGFKLWLDASLESLHATTIWLGHKSARKLMDYTRWADEYSDLFTERLRLYGVNSEAFKQRWRLLEARKRGLMAELQNTVTEANASTDPERQQTLAAQAQAMTIALHQMDGKLGECQAWIDMVEKYPAIEFPRDLPGGPVVETDPTVRAERAIGRREEAIELVADLPDVGPEAVAPNGAH